MNNSRSPVSAKPNGALLAALWVLEVSAALLATAVQRQGFGAALLTLRTRQSQYFVISLLGCALSIVWVALLRRRSGTTRARQFRLTVAMNALSLALLLLAGEISVRVLSVRTAQGRVFAGTLLHPRSWSDVARHNRELLGDAPSNISYFVSDPLLGWTIGPSRLSKNGLYASSAEGIRSPTPQAVYAGIAPPRRIALVGDSYTFGLEVRYEDTWGAHLQESLGTRYQVLNFGVDGYGVDQSCLRYDRDVRPWRPELVLFGFIDHDFYRSMAVYSFVSFPDWGFPFAKPRFAAGARPGSKPLNVPLPPPDEIAATRSIADLPFIGYDRGYREDDWQWKWYDHSYLLRLFVSRFRREVALGPEVSDEALRSLNSGLIASFVREAKEAGTVALVVYFPSRADFEPHGREPGAAVRSRQAVLGSLRAEGISYEDLTSCLAAAGGERLFIPGRPHYSPAGNSAVADCLGPLVAERLPGRSGI